MLIHPNLSQGQESSSQIYLTVSCNANLSYSIIIDLPKQASAGGHSPQPSLRAVLLGLRPRLRPHAERALEDPRRARGRRAGGQAGHGADGAETGDLQRQGTGGVRRDLGEVASGNQL